MSGRSWLAEARRRSLKSYEELPLPDRVGHAWRYTDPAVFLPPPAADDARSPIVHVLGPVPNGTEIEDLESAAERNAALIEPNLGRAIAAEAGKLEALNMARWRKGLLVRALPGRTAADPIHLSVCPRGPGFSALRLLAVAEEEASLSLALDFSGPDAGASSLNVALEIFVLPGGRFSLSAIQQLPPDATFYIAQHALVSGNSAFESNLLSLGGRTAKASLGAGLEGTGARAAFRGVIVGDGTQHFDHRTVLDHGAETGRSDFNYRTVLLGSARAAYTGLIRITENARECDAYQENRNLMLSDSARADTIPELEILNSEVRCAHGATTSGPDPEQLFYLMSRGLDLPRATKAIAEGFVDPVGSHVPGPYRERLARSIGCRLEKI